MASYALVNPSGVIVEIAAETFPVPPALTWTGDISGVSPAPAVRWAAAEAAGVWTFTAPAALPSTLVPAAMAALTASDRVASRCFKAGVAFPAPWQAYDQALRAIANGTTTPSALPAMPAYPEGT